MNDITKKAKQSIREMSPKIALSRIDDYKIPSPYRDVLIKVCIERKSMFEAEYLLREDGMSMSQRTLSRILRTGLEMFHKSQNGGTMAENWQEFMSFEP